MAITTSSELQKQLTVIFGFENQFQQKVGEIVGIGALSRQNTSNLINRVLNYLNAYNSMLIEYTGCRLYSIEFNLESYDSTSDMKLLPKSMVFVPGQFKDLNNLLLLLAPEMSLLEPKKSKRSLNQLGEQLYEISEVLDRKDLQDEEKTKILNLFARRFAYLLQGEVIEGKWKKKLIGLKTEEKEDGFLNINFEQIFNWQTKELLVKKYQARETQLQKTSNSVKKKFEIYKLHPKIILEIIQNSFKLTANLLQIANNSSVSDTQHYLLVLFLNFLKEKIDVENQRISIETFKKNLENFIPILQEYILEFKKYTQSFLTLHQIGSLEDLLTKFITNIPKFDDNYSKSYFFEILGILVKDHIKSNDYIYDFPDKIRTMEFETPFIYIYENSILVISFLQKSLPIYYQHFIMESLLVNLIEKIQISLTERNTSIIRILGIKSIHQLAQFYQLQIENFCNTHHCVDVDEILEDFKDLIQNTLSEFFQDLNFQIEGILEYCRERVPTTKKFTNTLDKLMLYRSRIETLWKLTLHQTTRKRIIEQVHEFKLESPESIANFVVDFLQKKFGGIQSSWKQNFFLYFEEYVKQYQMEYLEALENKEIWDSSTSLQKLFDFLENRVQKAISIEGFLEPLKDYLNKQAMNSVEKHPLLKIYDYYLEGIEIVEQFPEFLHQIINRNLETLEFSLSPYPVSFFLKSLPTLNYIINKDLKEPSNVSFSVSSYYDYLLNSELKYFSKLVAKPSQIILESLNRESFPEKPLKYRIKFEELGSKYMKTIVSTDFKYVLPKF